MKKQITINTGFWLLLLMGLVILSIKIGVHSFSLSALFHGSSVDHQIFWVSRFPRTLALVLVGAGLSVSGLLMQTLYHNRFLSPTTMGMMDFSRLGILLSMLFFGPSQSFYKLLFAFTISLVGTLLLLGLIARLKVKNEILVPLIGMVFGQIISALTSYLAYQFDLIQSMSSWLQGSFTFISNQNMSLLYLIIIGLLIIFFGRSVFNIVGLGEHFAINLGVNYQVVLFIGLAAISLISASSIITVGSIPFIGLIIGNVVTMLVGDNLNKAIPLAAIVGSSFLVFSDILSRVIIFPYEIPVSLVISVFGSILFLVLITRKSLR